MARPRGKLVIALAGWALLLGTATVATAGAQSPPSCAQTDDVTAPAQPSPGVPCWTDVEPYPFGTDGDPVDTGTLGCAAFPRPNTPPGPGYQGFNEECYLTVTSMAFRAWNRGIAATQRRNNETGPYRVWLSNGTRWYPDPTFPGQAVCGGDTVLWAGKLDYWLVGARGSGDLCRFDGSTFTWQPLSVPRETLAQLRTLGTSKAITSGTCFAWDDCWFFGSFGSVVRWDGTRLADASPDRVARPWLRTSYTAAVARAGGTGGRFAVAVGTAGGPGYADFDGQLAARPGELPPPQMYGLGAAGFSPLDYTPPTIPLPQDPYRTDFVAADIASNGHGWAAANPVGRRGPGPGGFGESPPGGRVNSATAPAPLLPLSPSGADPSCTAPPPTDRFRHGSSAVNTRTYLWSAIAVLPGSGDALAGGFTRPGTPVGPEQDDAGAGEPVLVRADCHGAVTEVRFRVPNPTAGFATTPLVPANRGGAVVALAAPASNDAWASTGRGSIGIAAGVQRPRLYRLTDGRPPAGEAGDDVEPRPIPTEDDPPIFVEESPPPEPPVVEVAPTTETTETTTTQTVRLLPAVYGARPLKPRMIKRGRDRGRFLLTVTFKVRRPATVGVRALHRGKVVGSSGLKRVSGTSARVVLKLKRRPWPTALRFYFPTAAQASTSASALSTEPQK